MNCRLAFVFSYERFKTALICIISIGPSTELSPIFNFPTFRKNETSLELFNIVFENSFPKGFFWCNEKKSEFFQLALYSRYLQTTALKSWLFQNTIFQAHLLFWDHALFSFRFVNNIPAGMEPKKTEPLKLGLILGLISGHCKASVLYSAIDLDVQTDRELERVKKWFQERGWRVKIGERDGGGEEKYACTQPLFVWRTPVHWIHCGSSAWCSFGCFDCQLPIKVTWQVTYPDSSRFCKIWFCVVELFQFLGLRISLIDGSKSKRLLDYFRDEIYWPHLSVFGLSEGNLEE